MATGSIKMSNKFHRLHGRYIMYHEATCSYLENNKGVVGSLLFIIDNVNNLYQLKYLGKSISKSFFAVDMVDSDEDHPLSTTTHINLT